MKNKPQRHEETNSFRVSKNEENKFRYDFVFGFLRNIIHFKIFSWNLSIVQDVRRSN